jgi:hypothetical protein
VHPQVVVRPLGGRAVGRRLVLDVLGGGGHLVPQL